MKQRTVLKKLKSEKGASSIVALLFFLVAMMVGSVVLASASANAGRASHALYDQREYYAVESAVNLLREDLTNEYAKTVITWSPVGEEGYRTVTKTEPNDKCKIIRMLFPTSGSTAKLSKDGIISNLATDKDFSIKVEDAENSYQIPEVVGKLTVSDDGSSITIELRSKGATPDRPESNTIVLTYASQINTKPKYVIDSTTGNVKSSTLETTISWYEVSLERPKTTPTPTTM